jgi:K+/H+ antiporter YhaU regulatory subunit KhtT
LSILLIDKRFKMSILNSEEMMRYLYKEMTPEESKEFLAKVGETPDIQEQFTEMKEGLEKLEEIQFSPSSSVIDRIMHYGSTSAEGLSKA